MLDETTYHIRKIADHQWKIELWLHNVLVASKVVESQHEIGKACQEMRENHEQVDVNKMSK